MPKASTVSVVLACATAVVAGPSASEAAFPGANGGLAFVRDGQIYVSRADGTRTVQISSGGFNSAPTWSRDGRRLVYATTVLGQLDLMTVDADGGDQRRLTNDANLETHPAWAPGGQRIVFGRVPPPGGRSELFVMNSDGSGVTGLGAGFFPAWSPDGSRIAFTADDPRGGAQIYVMNADGSGRAALTSGAGVNHGPAWSPDGSKIAFVSSREGSLEIYSMNADGTNQGRLTSGARSNCGGPCEIGPFTPAWSPDGTRIAYASDRDESRDLFVISADGTGAVKVASTAEGQEYDVDWQPAVDLRASVTARRARVGRPVTLAVVVRNASSLQASAVSLRVRFPRTARVVRATGTGVSCKGRFALACNLGGIGRGESRRVALILRPRVARAVVVTASATSQSPEAAPADNVARVRVSVRRGG